MTETTITSRCPACGVRHGVASAIDHTSPPKEGDVTVCMNCAATLVFERLRAGLKLRRPTEAEAAELRRFAPLNRVKAAVIAVAREEGRELP